MMAPKPRQRQKHATHESDYDTDAHQIETSHNQGPESRIAAINPPLRSNDELNLSVLRRHYADVNQVLSVAPFAVVYAFSPDSQSWEKTGVEGTLFICQLMSIPSGGSTIERFSVVVLNRKGLDNYMAELQSSSNVEVTDDYVILQATDPNTQAESVSGLWIFTEPEPSSTARAREINAQIIVECAARAEKSRAVTVNANHTNGHVSGPQQANVNPQQANADNLSYASGTYVGPVSYDRQQHQLHQHPSSTPSYANGQDHLQSMQANPQGHGHAHPPPQPYHQHHPHHPQHPHHAPAPMGVPSQQYQQQSQHPQYYQQQPQQYQSQAQAPAPTHGHPQVQYGQPAPSQQNLLLNLFQSAQRG